MVRKRILITRVINPLTVIAAILLASSLAKAQDSTRANGRRPPAADSIARLHAVSVVATPAERAQPLSATHVTAADVRITPSSSPYELLRQTAGLEVHLQGQGPGFASDASLRGFSSDHSTDIALWVDG
ncbi:MAG TPA: TonB-dependent receptor plug domain-containing protein, partial [Gemmatimonadaceae bacterium]|nr:TonB-dependent receptor plug domain-containing protein [Gemmatimonadaceae bacterium]